MNKITIVRSGEQQAGDITIDSQFVILDRSRISTDVFGGPGGNVKISADIFLNSDSLITASWQRSMPGTIDIQASITDVSGSLAQLSEAVLQATSLLQQSCAARCGGGQTSSFVVGGRDGLLLEPDGFMPIPLHRLESLSAQPSTIQGIGTQGHQLAPASAKPVFSINLPCTK